MSLALSVLVEMRKVPIRTLFGTVRDTSAIAALHSATLASIAARLTGTRSSGGPEAAAAAKEAMYAASSRESSTSCGRSDSRRERLELLGELVALKVDLSQRSKGCKAVVKQAKAVGDKVGGLGRIGDDEAQRPLRALPCARFARRLRLAVPFAAGLR
eukprot:scaffold43252_cov28-Tisochrysis_lutea.AAC.2